MPLTDAMTQESLELWERHQHAQPLGLVVFDTAAVTDLDGASDLLLQHVDLARDIVIWWNPGLAFVTPRITDPLDLTALGRQLGRGVLDSVPRLTGICSAGQPLTLAIDQSFHQLRTREAKASSAPRSRRSPHRHAGPRADWAAIKAQVDMLDVVHRRIPTLKPYGGYLWRGFCPFHTDTRTPNLMVYPGTPVMGGHVYCFAEKQRWDLFTFVRQFDHLTSDHEAALVLMREMALPPLIDRPPMRLVDNIWGEWSIPTKWPEVYGQLWKVLSLTETHHAYLKAERHLTDDAIQQLGFRSMPVREERSGWWRRLGTDQAGLAGVPGFSFKDDGYLHGPPGILIPVRSRHGDIIGAQILVDQRESGGKYLWLSTPPEKYEGGTSSGTPPHVAMPQGAGPEASWPYLFVTEGVLKATLAAEPLDSPVIGVAGVGRFNAAQPLLELMQPQSLVLAFDADVWMRKHLFKQALDALDAYQNNPALTRDQIWLAVWDPRDGNGLDDVLLAGHPIDVVRPEEHLASLPPPV